MPRWLSVPIITFVLLASSLVLNTNVARADERDFRFENNSDDFVIFLYVSPTHEDHWGDDVLGASIVEPGEAGTVSFYDDLDTCEYDIKVVVGSGPDAFLYEIDLCSTHTVTYGG